MAVRINAFNTIHHHELCPNKMSIYGTRDGEEFDTCELEMHGLERDERCIHIQERRFPEGKPLFYCENCGVEKGPIFTTLAKAQVHAASRHLRGEPQEIKVKLLHADANGIKALASRGRSFYIRYGEIFNDEPDWSEVEEVKGLAVNPSGKVNGHEYTDCSSPRGGLCWRGMPGCSYFYYDGRGTWYRYQGSEHCVQIFVKA